MYTTFISSKSVSIIQFLLIRITTLLVASVSYLTSEEHFIDMFTLHDVSKLSHCGNSAAGNTLQSTQAEYNCLTFTMYHMITHLCVYTCYYL